MAVLEQSRLLLDDEVFDASMVQNLRAACRVLRLNGRAHDARVAEALVPEALLASGQFAEALDLALELFDRVDLAATSRLDLGLLALLRLAPSRHSDDVGRFLGEVTALMGKVAPAAALLPSRAAMALFSLHSSLGEAGVRTCLACVHPGTLTPASAPVRQRAAAWQAVLAEDCAAAPRSDRSPARAGLVMCLLRAVAGSPDQIGPAFERFRADHPGEMAATSWLYEGQANAWAGQFTAAVDRLRMAWRVAGSTRRRDLMAMIEFELASALMTAGLVDEAQSHALAFYQAGHDAAHALALSLKERRREEDDSSDRPANINPGPAEAWMLQTEPPYLRRVCEFIARSLAEALTPADLVVASKVSRRSLEAAFRTYRGTSPMGYLKACRLDEACRLLQQTELSLSDVRRAVGYDSAALFSTDYRKRFGVPPSTVRGHGSLQTR